MTQLPDKNIASLVKYYYSWKKTRSRTSVIDRQQEKNKTKEGSENGSENGSNEDSDTEEKVSFHILFPFCCSRFVSFFCINNGKIMDFIL